MRKINAVIEILIVFLLTGFAFSWLRYSSLGTWSSPQIGNFPIPYFSVLLIPILINKLRARSLFDLGLSQSEIRFDLRLIGFAIIPGLLIKMTLYLVDWREWSGALLVSVSVVIATFILVRSTRSLQLTGASQIFLSLVFLSLSAPSAQFELPNWITLLYRMLYVVLVALAEEVLFRGYIQGRLDEVFGKPMNLSGVQMGYGLILTSVLFGFWHIMHPVIAGIDLANSLAWGLWTFFLGIFLGVLRLKSGRLIVPTAIHWMINI